MGNSLANNGWILIGDETGTLNAKRIYSREYSIIPSKRPKLTVNYTAIPPPTHFESWLAAYFPANRVGQYVNPAADFAGDGIPSLVKYAYALSPVTPIAPSAGVQGSLTTVGENDIFTYTFRRDVLATDLTYEFQSTGDFVTWSTITTSIGGAAPGGSAYVTESGADIRVVVVQEMFPTPAKRFVRLRISRTQ